MRMHRTSRRQKLLTNVLVLATALTFTVSAPGQKAPSPSETAISFYKALREKRYLDGFRLSVYKDAVEGLSADELRQLEPDFARTFSGIPEKIEPVSEHVDGDSATVSLKFEGTAGTQPVALIRVGGRWLVGDAEALRLVQSQGREFFFNARMSVNEGEAAEMLYRIIGAQTIYARQKQGLYASLDELILLGGIPKDWESGTSGGYHVTLRVASDQKSFFVTAEPIQYGKTGKLSFYADLDNLRAEDLKGKPANAKSPVYTIK
jgi:hypothetical protein